MSVAVLKKTLMRIAKSLEKPAIRNLADQVGKEFSQKGEGIVISLITDALDATGVLDKPDALGAKSLATAHTGNTLSRLVLAAKTAKKILSSESDLASPAKSQQPSIVKQHAQPKPKKSKAAAHIKPFFNAEEIIKLLKEFEALSPENQQTVLQELNSFDTLIAQIVRDAKGLKMADPTSAEQKALIQQALADTAPAITTDLDKSASDTRSGLKGLLQPEKDHPHVVHAAPPKKP